MPKTPIHTVRLDDELWQAARQKAAETNRTLSEIIRSGLAAWIQQSGGGKEVTLFEQLPSLQVFQDGLPAWLQDAISGYLSCDDLNQTVTRLNTIRSFIAEFSPFSGEPVDLVEWVSNETVRANDYNPNSVAPPEMELLRHSIMADGYTQPIVTMPEGDDRVVIDGFHRHRVGKELSDVRNRVHGYLPVVRIREDRTGRNDRIAATIRHNRARGKHRVDAMSEIVVELKRRNWSEERIGKELGMEPDEVLRLCQMSGLAELFSDDEFSASWDVIEPDDFEELDDRTDLAERQPGDRVFHTWDQWECFEAGFYNPIPAGKIPAAADRCKDWLRGNDVVEALDSVLRAWPRSCEHYLSNPRMDRITWLKQSAVCLALGISAAGYSEKGLSEEELSAVNLAALSALNQWLSENSYEKLPDLAAAARTTQPELY